MMAAFWTWPRSRRGLRIAALVLALGPFSSSCAGRVVVRGIRGAEGITQGEVSMYVPKESSQGRIREAANARGNRLEIVKALSHGQITRRDLVKWGIFTTLGGLAWRSEERRV